MKPRIDELTMLFHVYFPTIRLSLTRDSSESDIAVYEYFGPRAGTYTLIQHVSKVFCMIFKQIAHYRQLNRIKMQFFQQHLTLLKHVIHIVL